MKSGSPGQKDLSFALELLGKVEKIISSAGLNLSHRDVQDLGNGLATARGLFPGCSERHRREQWKPASSRLRGAWIQ